MDNVILFADGALLAHVAIISIILMMRSFDSFDTYDHSCRSPFLSLILMLLLTLVTVIFIFMLPPAIYMFFGLAASLDISQFDGKALTYVRNQGLQELPIPKTPFLLGFLIAFPLAARWLPALMKVFGNKKILVLAAEEISARAIKEFLLFDVQKFKNLGPIDLSINLCSGDYEISDKIKRSLKTPNSIHKHFTRTSPFQLNLEKSQGSSLILNIRYATDKTTQIRSFKIAISLKLRYGFSTRHFSDSIAFTMPLTETLGYMNVCEHLNSFYSQNS